MHRRNGSLIDRLAKGPKTPIPRGPYVHEACRPSRHHRPLSACQPLFNARAPKACAEVPCRFLATVGFCPNGVNCMYSHAAAPTAAAEAAARAVPPSSPRRPPRPRHEDPEAIAALTALAAAGLEPRPAAPDLGPRPPRGPHPPSQALVRRRSGPPVLLLEAGQRGQQRPQVPRRPAVRRQRGRPSRRRWQEAAPSVQRLRRKRLGRRPRGDPTGLTDLALPCLAVLVTCARAAGAGLPPRSRPGRAELRPPRPLCAPRGANSRTGHAGARAKLRVLWGDFVGCVCVCKREDGLFEW
ncbi:unnamed protein product [Prorocentrum cordatum]|uniref:C3H1-type domain-containing protein n=1 Tax=Prorocentrum cordatum TaxID=2364126 RepID=A0ABN9WVU2_9DINO|nr:unnamed protein product [Polarella glacialis]